MIMYRVVQKKFMVEFDYVQGGPKKVNESI